MGERGREGKQGDGREREGEKGRERGEGGREGKEGDGRERGRRE